MTNESTGEEMDSNAVKEYLLELQELIVDRLEQVDGKKFIRDSWTRAAGSSGGTRLCDALHLCEA